MSWLSGGVKSLDKLQRKVIGNKTFKKFDPVTSKVSDATWIPIERAAGIETPNQKRNREAAPALAAAAYGEPTAQASTREDPYGAYQRQRRRKKGGGSTILAGPLTPMDVGKRTLLG